MNYTREQTDLADDIFASLATSPDHAVPRSSSSLYSAYLNDTDVQSLVDARAEKYGCRIIQTRNGMYLAPVSQDSFFGFTRSELVQKLTVYRNNDTTPSSLRYCFAMSVILKLCLEFYSGRGEQMKIRSSLPVEDLIRDLTEFYNEGAEREKHEREEGGETSTGIRFTDIKNYWDPMLNEDRGSNGTLSKKQAVDKVLRFLSSQHFITYDSKVARQIGTTLRFDELMTALILGQSNYRNLIAELFKPSDAGLSEEDHEQH